MRLFAKCDHDFDEDSPLREIYNARLLLFVEWAWPRLRSRLNGPKHTTIFLQRFDCVQLAPIEKYRGKLFYKQATFFFFGFQFNAIAKIVNFTSLPKQQLTQVTRLQK